MLPMDVDPHLYEWEDTFEENVGPHAWIAGSSGERGSCQGSWA
jgi:hypothetical protein